MSRRAVELQPADLAALPGACGACEFWERGPYPGERPGPRPDGQLAPAKREWFAEVRAAWGPCGLVVRADGEVLGHAFFAPAELTPRAAAFPTSPVGADAAVLLTVRVRDDMTRQGIGRALVQGVARELVQRQVRALEAFGAAGAPAAPCVLPVGFLEAVGFVPVREHPRWPRMRLDLRTTVSWRADVEEALERLLHAVRRDPVTGPA